MPPTAQLPSAFETLAGLAKFIAVAHISPEFYQQHTHAIEFTCAFLRTAASLSPAVEAAFRKSLPMPVNEGATVIEGWEVVATSYPGFETDLETLTRS